MKKSIVWFSICVVLVMGLMMGCGNAGTNLTLIKSGPKLQKIKNICELSTLKCYSHNVAIVDKAKNEDGTLFDFLKKDRTLWIEYTGVATIGIDASKIEMDTDGNEVTITIPEAKLINVAIDDESLTEDSFYESQDDWLVKNVFTTDYQKDALKTAQKQMEEAILANPQLMRNAQIRAQRLIENYIIEVGKSSENPFVITWVYEDGTSSNSIPDEDNISAETIGEEPKN